MVQLGNTVGISWTDLSISRYEERVRIPDEGRTMALSGVSLAYLFYLDYLDFYLDYLELT